MYKPNQWQRTSLKVCKQTEGETIEVKMERMMQQGADINDVTEQIFTERKDGVLPETDIRADRWEVAIEATDLQAKGHLAKRDERHKMPEGEEGLKDQKPDTKSGDKE